MTWIIAIAISIIVLVVLASAGSSKPSAESRSPKKVKASQSAKEIAAEISTPAQFRALERKLEKADENRQSFQSYDSRSSAKEDRLEEKYQVLQEAYDIASNNVLLWQFIPEVDLHTPLKIVKAAYKTYSRAEYCLAKEELTPAESWYGIRGDEEPDQIDDETKFVLKFRRIVENAEISSEEQAKKINSLVSRNKEVSASYFDMESSKKPSQQWLSGEA